MIFLRILPVLALAACSMQPSQEDTLPPLHVLSFEHRLVDGQTEILIGFNRDDIDVRAIISPTWPHRRVIEQDENGLWVVPLGPEPSDNDGEYDQYTVYLAMQTSTGERHDLWIDRQSAAELEDAFNFVKADGYSVIAETTMELPGADYAETFSFNGIYSELPAGVTSADAPGEMPDELRLAAQAMVWLNNEGLTYSPSTPRPTYTSLADELDALRNGGTGNQCGDYRIIWTHIAIDLGVQVRWINLASFIQTPAMPDATPYAHAAAEIWADGHGWIYFDPWLNFAFQRNGEWLSAEEIRETLRNAPSELVRVRPTSNLTRTGRYALGGEGPLDARNVYAPPMDFYRGYFAVVGVVSLDVTN